MLWREENRTCYKIFLSFLLLYKCHKLPKFITEFSLGFLLCFFDWQHFFLNISKKIHQCCSLQRLHLTCHIGGKEDNTQGNHLELTNSCPTLSLLITQWELWMGSEKHSEPIKSHLLTEILCINIIGHVGNQISQTGWSVAL